MSDDDTRELPSVEASADDESGARTQQVPDEAVAAAQGAGATATATTTEEDETVRIERITAEPPADDETAPPTTPLPPVPPTGPAPRTEAGTEPPAEAFATGHIRVMPAAAPPAPEPLRRPTLRVGTVVWGLVVVAVGVGLLSVSWGAHLDTELAFIVLLGAAGVALLVGSLVGMRRSRHR